MNEALVAATINAAAALGQSASYGSIEVGKMADMLVLDVPRYQREPASQQLATLRSTRFFRTMDKCVFPTVITSC